MPASAPCLSICVPTCNGGAYIESVLNALMPQVESAAGLVEVVVVDDASEDGIEAFVRSEPPTDYLRFVRQAVNVGMANNIASAITVHARGEFVWVISQHNLLLPGALNRILESIESRPDIDALQVNFQCATFPSDWPANPAQPVAREFQYLSRSDCESRVVDRWEDLLEPQTGIGTQTYSHIVRRSLATSFLINKKLGREFETALDTYTQTCVVANVMFGKPCYYIGEPVITIFNGAQTWSSLRDRARVYLSGYPDLLRTYKRLGWGGAKFNEAQAWGASRARGIVEEIFRGDEPAERRRIWSYLAKFAVRLDGAAGAVWTGMIESQAIPLLAPLTRTIDRSRRYFLHDWRPARWLRSR